MKSLPDIGRQSFTNTIADRGEWHADMTPLDIGFVCDTGDRKETNEDSILIKTCQYNNEEWGLFLVADGMGGMAYGTEASRMIVETMSQWWDTEFIPMLSTPCTLEAIAVSLDQAIIRTNEYVVLFSEQVRKKTGSTLSLLLLMGRDYLIRHIGDSRVYVLNQGMEQLTPDHSYVADQVKNGLIAPEDAIRHPKRNIITKCIGGKRDMELFQYQSVWRTGDVFLLCSDGFYTLVPDAEVLDTVFADRYYTMLEKAQALRARIGNGRAYDNVSIILIRQELSEDTEAL